MFIMDVVTLLLIAATLWLCCQSVLAAIVNTLLDAIRRQPARAVPVLFPLEQSVQETGESPLGHGTLVGTLQPI